MASAQPSLPSYIQETLSPAKADWDWWDLNPRPAAISGAAVLPLHHNPLLADDMLLSQGHYIYQN